jgi:predicted transcriptional regulator
LVESNQVKADVQTRLYYTPSTVISLIFLDRLGATALSKEALELLGVLLREQPANVTDLVALTGRAQSNISRSLQLLAKLRLIRLVRDGRGVRPEPIARILRVDLATGTYETTPVSEAAA